MSKSNLPFEKLLALAVGELSSAEAQATERQAAALPEAARILAHLRTTLSAMRGDDSVAPPAAVVARVKALFAKLAAPQERTRWLERVEQAVAALIYDSRTQPALAGYRSAADGFQLSFESESADVDVEVAPLPEPPGDRWRIMGQVSTHGDSPQVAIALARSGTFTPVAETVADEHGVFTLSAASGEYDVFLCVSGRVVILPKIAIE